MDNNFVPLRRMTLAEYNAQKYKIGSSDLTEITDSVDTPMAIGTNLMLSEAGGGGGGGAPTTATYVTTTDEALLPNSTNLGALGVDGAYLLQSNISSGTATIEGVSLNTNKLLYTNASGDVESGLSFSSNNQVLNINVGTESLELTGDLNVTGNITATGTITPGSGGGGAPTTATYVTTTAEALLPNSTNLGALGGDGDYLLTSSIASGVATIDATALSPYKLLYTDINNDLVSGLSVETNNDPLSFNVGSGTFTVAGNSEFNGALRAPVSAWLTNTILDGTFLQFGSTVDFNTDGNAFNVFSGTTSFTNTGNLTFNQDQFQLTSTGTVSLNSGTNAFTINSGNLDINTDVGYFNVLSSSVNLSAGLVNISSGTTGQLAATGEVTLYSDTDKAVVRAGTSIELTTLTGLINTNATNLTFTNVDDPITINATQQLSINMDALPFEVNGDLTKLNSTNTEVYGGMKFPNSAPSSLLYLNGLKVLEASNTFDSDSNDINYNAGTADINLTASDVKINGNFQSNFFGGLSSFGNVFINGAFFKDGNESFTANTNGQPIAFNAGGSTTTFNNTSFFVTAGVNPIEFDSTSIQFTFPAGIVENRLQLTTSGFALDAPAQFNSNLTQTGGYISLSPQSGNLTIANLTAANAVTLMRNASTGIITVQTSSRRYKENIKVADLKSDFIYDLKPVTFDYISSKSHSFGYIAEEVPKELNELLIYDESGQPEAISYHMLSVYLVEELKKLRTRIAALES